MSAYFSSRKKPETRVYVKNDHCSECGQKIPKGQFLDKSLHLESCPVLRYEVIKK